MAKKLVTDNTSVKIVRKGTTWRLRSTFYEPPQDTVDTTIEAYTRVGQDEGPRDLTAGELAGTLQAFLDGCDTTHKATEGI